AFHSVRHSNCFVSNVSAKPRTFILSILLALFVRGAQLHSGPEPPITFEENRGQAPPEIAFLSHVRGFDIFLTRSGDVIAAGKGAPVLISLSGANAAGPEGVHRIAARSNYFIGSDPTRWQTNITNYQKVRFAHAYPGIDILWHARGSQIEHDFLVAQKTD